ncbi:hypothetical protein WBU85_12940 [Escherichia coli]
MWTLKEAYIKSRGIGLSEEIIKNLDFYIKRDQFDKLYFYRTALLCSSFIYYQINIR